MNYFILWFSSFEQKIIHLPSVYWLTYSLICPHIALKNLAKVEKPYSVQTFTGFQAVSHLANALFGGNSNLDHVYLKGDMK